MIQTPTIKLSKYELTDAANLADGYNNSMDILDEVCAEMMARFPIQTDDIADRAVTSSKLNNGSVTTDKIVDANVTNSKLASDSVTTDKIMSSAITNEKLAQNSVGTANIMNGSVDNNKLYDKSVTTNKLADECVTTNNLADGCVTAAKLADGSFTQIRTDFAAADAQIRTEFAAADTALGARIDKITKNNPIYYGADPTGVNDSSAAINDCINACKGQTIVFTTGTYKLNAPIKTPYASADRVSIDFNGSVLTYSGSSATAAIMIGYSDNPSATQIENGSTPYNASYFKNLSLWTPLACTYAIEINTHYQNVKFENISVNTATNGIRIGENATNIYPTDFLFTNSFVNCTTKETTYTGITINGTDNRFEQLRVYGFAVYFDINAYSNWFSYIHTLGISENSRNGISYNTHGSINWFNNIYNDTVRTCIKVNADSTEINVNTAFDYAWIDIDNRCFIDCSEITKTPDYIFVDGLTANARNKRYNGIKVKSNNTDFTFSNKFNIKNVKMKSCNYTDAILPYDDIIRMGLKSSFTFFDDTGTNYYPIAAIICGDKSKYVDFTLTCNDRKTNISFSQGDSIANFKKSDVFADVTRPYELCFMKYDAKNTMTATSTYIIGVKVAGNPIFKLDNIPEQADSVIVPIQSGTAVKANSFGTVTPTYTFAV